MSDDYGHPVRDFCNCVDCTLSRVLQERDSLLAEVERLRGEVKERRDERYYHGDSLKWGWPIDVGHLVEQLKTLDPHMKVGSVMHIEIDGKKKARAFGLSMSRERWGESGWLDYQSSGPLCLAIWASLNDSEKIVSLEADNARLTSEQQHCAKCGGVECHALAGMFCGEHSYEGCREWGGCPICENAKLKSALAASGRGK